MTDTKIQETQAQDKDGGSQAKEEAQDSKVTDSSASSVSSKAADRDQGGKAQDRFQRLRTNFKAMPIIDKVLGITAVLVVVGWLTTWLSGEESVQLFKSWFQTLSFFGALVVFVVESLRLHGKQPLSETYQRKCLAVASLLPVAGFVFHISTSVGTFLTMGGSIALAYFSATTYWRKNIPDFVTDPLGQDAKAEGRPAAASDKTADAGESRTQESATGKGSGKEKEDSGAKKEREKVATTAA